MSDSQHKSLPREWVTSVKVIAVSAGKGGVGSLIGAPCSHTSFLLERLLVPSKKGVSSGCNSRL